MLRLLPLFRRPIAESTAVLSHILRQYPCHKPMVHGAINNMNPVPRQEKPRAKGGLAMRRTQPHRQRLGLKLGLAGLLLLGLGDALAEATSYETGSEDVRTFQISSTGDFRWSSTYRLDFDGATL